jgi:hypothetical protein
LAARAFANLALAAAQNTDAGLASAQALSGQTASIATKMSPIDCRILFSRFGVIFLF